MLDSPRFPGRMIRQPHGDVHGIAAAALGPGAIVDLSSLQVKQQVWPSASAASQADDGLQVLIRWSGPEMGERRLWPPFALGQSSGIGLALRRS